MEEAPAEFEEAVEEGVHLCRRDDFCKQREVPVSSEDLNVHAYLLQVLEKLGQMCLHKLSNQGAMLYVARQPLHVDVSHLIVFNQCDEEPEGNFFATMPQQSAHDEVHALDVAYLRIILRESLKHSLEALLPLALPFLKDFLVRERARDIALNLTLLSHTDEVLDA